MADIACQIRGLKHIFLKQTFYGAPAKRVRKICISMKTQVQQIPGTGGSSCLDSQIYLDRRRIVNMPPTNSKRALAKTSPV